jgi:uncharacterized protein (DUF1684 family)
MTSATTAIEVADWRQRVFAIYAQVRSLSVSDPAQAHSFWRDARDELFRTHPQTPLLPEDRSDFTGLPVAPYDPAWRFEVEIESPDAPGGFDFETGTDGVVPFELLGTATIPGVGTLDVWRLRSYGGGRYLLDTIKGAHLGQGTADASLMLDFNFAYNPSCAYDPAWACPLAPLGNRVSTDIPVGELYVR